MGGGGDQVITLVQSLEAYRHSTWFFGVLEVYFAINHQPANAPIIAIAKLAGNHKPLNLKYPSLHLKTVWANWKHTIKLKCLFFTPQ